MKRTLWAVLMVALAGTTGVARADDKEQKSTGPKAGHEAFMGVAVQAVSAAMRSHLAGQIPEGQGLMVDHVAKDSPAAKAGLKAHDILLAFGDQKLSSPEQLVKMVRADKPGQMIAVSYLRGGKPATAQVTLGERPQEGQPQAGAANPNVYRFAPTEEFDEFFGELDSKNNEASWSSFEAMKLTRVDEKHWAAEIDYRNKEGKKETRKFTGTREEIRKDIMTDKDLPADERHHLLRAMHMERTVFEFHFPSGSLPGDPNQQP